MVYPVDGLLCQKGGYCMVKKKLWCLLLVMALALSLGLSAQVQAEPLDPVDVLVTFYQPPGEGEIGLIESLGGTVNKVYHVVPTIAATMPA
jgi:hypothetical protein